MLPPLLAIVLAIATRRVVIPLGCGVLLGIGIALWNYPGELTAAESIGLYVRRLGAEAFDAVAGHDEDRWFWTSGHLQAFAFSLLLGAMVGVLERGGSMAAVIASLARMVGITGVGRAGRRAAQRLIAASGLAIFFDDYANTLLVGGTMRSTADRFAVSREKLAYLVDSTSAPIAGLSVISTWAAIEISYIEDGLVAGGVVAKDGGTPEALKLFIASIPYRFYPILALVMVAVIVITGRDFGPMASAEADAAEGTADEAATTEIAANDTFGQDVGGVRNDDGHVGDDADPVLRWRGRLGRGALVALTTIGVCLAVVLGVLIQTGRQSLVDNGDVPSFGSIIEAAEVMGQGDPYLSLVFGGGCGLITAWLMQTIFRRESPLDLLRWTMLGAMQMMPAMVILWLAWALSSVTGLVGTDTFLASLLSDNLPPWSLPAVVFLASAAMAFSTGTSWGTMGILTPLSISLAVRMSSFPIETVTSDPLLLGTTGAVLAGAIMGDHCSPISDTTVLSSRASGCDHVAHVRTQMPYALSVGGIATALAVASATINVSPWIGLAIASVLIAAMVRWGGRDAAESQTP